MGRSGCNQRCSGSHPSTALRSYGDDRDRTGNLRLAKPALSQLSYVPSGSGQFAVPSCAGSPFRFTHCPFAPGPVGVLGFEPRTSALSELRSSQLSYTPSSRETKKPNHIGFGPTRRHDGIELYPPSRIVIRFPMNSLPTENRNFPADFRRNDIIREHREESTGKKLCWGVGGS